MNNKQQEIKEIVAQLRHLQREEEELLRRLEQLNITENQTFESPRAQTTREFKIGDLVQIRNPKIFQIKKGTIVRIGSLITVQAKNGTKIVRAPSNIIHIN